MKLLKNRVNKGRSAPLNRSPDAFEIWKNLDSQKATEQWRSFRDDLNPLDKLLRKKEAAATK